MEQLGHEPGLRVAKESLIRVQGMTKTETSTRSRCWWEGGPFREIISVVIDDKLRKSEFK